MSAAEIEQQVIDLYEYQDGAFLVKGDVDRVEARRQVAAFLDHTLGARVWSDLRVILIATWYGGFEYDEATDDERWVPRAGGDPWTYVLTEYEA